ncbi:MAG: pyruvate dehydrogenase [Aquabacterium sp.]|uniref:dehydrogenase E1 component subunit alpha/beta n=1 Tax=Aquabacterium sp. TaxID=1872578 RepID=UPI0025C342E6|nr:alpha-ketoacid dehydrogenase subunit alpha/beta [Aquabacterium sp.]MBI5925016.1 pyruvate dehydrogenase [Aquabacterium sp.]
MTGLSKEQRKRILENALLSRFVEEELLALFAKGKLFGTVHTCIGEEFSGAAVCDALLPGDTVFSNHRCHGHFISKTGDIRGLLAELMGREGGVCAGVGGSQHLCKDGFYSNGIQGGIVPVAAGLAYAQQLRASKHVSVVFIGDGTLGEGVIYEAFNIAAKWALPLLIVLEDNKFAQSTSQSETLAGGVRERAEAFGIDSAVGSTWEWEQLAQTAATLIAAMREDGRPRFLHIDTYRLKAHSKGDDTRPRELVEPFEWKDPLNILLGNATGEERAWIDTLERQVKEAATWADAQVPAVYRHAVSSRIDSSWQCAPLLPKSRVVAALNDCFRQAMAKDPSILMIGEDILSPYGGAFKVTKGLSDEFPDRVRNTPISEAAIVGLGVGLAMMGARPVVEIMFGDFVGLAFDQLVNHAAKFNQMYAGQVAVDLIVRTPMGGGRGYGPTHSQSLEKHFFGVPGLTVLAVNALTDPGQVYGPLLDGGVGPALVVENKLLYSAYFIHEPPLGFELLHSTDRFPVAWLRPQSEVVDVILLGYGGTAHMMAEAAEILFDEHEVVAQVLCVMQVFPFDVESISLPLGESKRLLIVDESQSFGAFGAEVMAQMVERGMAAGRAIRRLNAAEVCIPASGDMEKMVLPGVLDIVAAALEMV